MGRLPLEFISLFLSLFLLQNNNIKLAYDSLSAIESYHEDPDHLQEMQENKNEFVSYLEMAVLQRI